MSDPTKNEQTTGAADLNTLRDRCGALENALLNERDAARVAELQRELAECRQQVFEAEQREPREQEADAELPSAGMAREHVRVEGNGIEATDRDTAPNYAGLYAAERAENAELRAELAGTEGQGISRERERLHPAIEYAQAQRHAEELSHAGVSPELAAEYQARILARDESFSGEVVQQIERENESRAYVIEADDDRVVVPQIEGAEMDVGDDVEVSRDHQGNYEAETGYGYGR